MSSIICQQISPIHTKQLIQDKILFTVVLD